MNTAEADHIWALEIEVATVSVLWRQPQRLAEFLRVIDPLVHLTQPHLRIIVEAINLAYGELGAADWATVVQVVRELGAFEECGELDGLNTVYAATESVVDPIFNHYVETLQTYARHRAMDPPRAVSRFTGGKASLYINKAKRHPKDPDYLGEARVRGASYELRAWLGSDQESVNITLEPR